MADETTVQTFAEAFDSDLKTYNLEQSKVCELLSPNEPAPISSAAISNWKRRNTIPIRRLEKLVEIFGSSSKSAEYLKWVRENPSPTVRRLSSEWVNPRRAQREAVLRDPPVVVDRSFFTYQRPELQVAQRPPRPVVSAFGGVTWSDIVSGIRERVPTEHQNGFDREFRIGEIKSRFDFIGERSIIAFTRLSSLMMGSVYRQMFRMAMIQKVIGPDGKHKPYVIAVRQELDERQLLAVVEPEDDDRYMRAFRRVATEARIMGIQMELAEDYDKAAKMIVKWETKPLVFEEEEEEEEEMEDD